MSNYLDFFAVMESDVDAGERNRAFAITGEGKNPDGSLSFLQYKGCLMSVGHRNRNKRLWTKDVINVMMNAPHIVEQLRNAGGLPGENGHPIPITGKVSMDRIVTIDPNNLAILVKDWWWEGDLMMGTVQTLDQGPGTPGNRLAMNIVQGIVPAHSARTLVPQRYNPDGTIDVTGPGRMVCFDRVHGPSCAEAYQDVSVPVKNIISKKEFEVTMESFTNILLEKSENVRRVLDSMDPVMESASYDSGMLNVATESNGRVFIPVERNYRQEIANFMANF